MVDLTKKLESSFLSCEKDSALILKKLFVQDRKHARELKRLLVVNMPDCLDNLDNELYKKAEEMSVKELISKGYIRLNPKIRNDEFEEVKAYIIISMDNFITNETNPEFRDCVVNFDIICHTDYWDLGNFRQRPIKIAGYIDGVLNKTKLTGIGTFNFLGCNELILDHEYSGYTISFLAIHGEGPIGGDDKIEGDY